MNPDPPVTRTVLIKHQMNLAAGQIQKTLGEALSSPDLSRRILPSARFELLGHCLSPPSLTSTWECRFHIAGTRRERVFLITAPCGGPAHTHPGGRSSSGTPARQSE